MDMSQRTSLTHKAIAVIASVLLALSLTPLLSLSAYADDGNAVAGEGVAAEEVATTGGIAADEGVAGAASEGEATDGVALQAAEAALPEAAVQAADEIVASPLDGEVSGGSVISASGTYTIAANATGTIAINDNLEVVLVGQGIEAGKEYTDLNIVVGDSSKLTLQNVYITLSTMNTVPSAIDFTGKGTLAVSGQNIIDQPGASEDRAIKVFPSVIHVGADADVTFEGDGVLYGYKSSIGGYIGGTNTQVSGEVSEVNGKITFKSGTWCLKGTKTAAIIGNDCSTATGAEIRIEGGALYLKTVSKGAAIGASPYGQVGAVVMTGGQVEILTDFAGSAIGLAGSPNDATKNGTFAMSGGSLKTLVTTNGYDSWGITSSDPFVVTDKLITATKTDGNAHEIAMLTFDASAYAEQASVTLAVDGATYFEGPLYQYSTNTDKSPTGNYTPDNWTAGQQTNLYLHLTKENHVITVGSDVYNCTWDSATEAFTVVKKDLSVDGDVWNGNIDVSWYDPAATEFTLTKPAQLAGLAAIVNGCYDDGAYVVGDSEYIKIEGAFNYGIDDFKGKTIKLGANMDMGGVLDAGTSTWSGPLYMPIGGQYAMHTSDGDITISASFNGTFDGRGYTVSNINGDRGTGQSCQSVGLIGRLGNHDDDPASMRADNPTVKNVVVSGFIKGGRSIGGIVGKIGKTNNGATITNCVNNATVVSSDAKGVGGICGAAWNGGSISNCYNTGSISGGYPAGGIAGSNEIAISNCYSIGVVTSGKGNNYAMAMGTIAAAGSFTDCYWLDGVAAGGGIYGGTGTNCAAKTADELKAADMLALLGDDFVSDAAGVNNGYPVLRWQVDPVAIESREIAGDTRIETAIEAANEAYPEGAEGVIVATAWNYPDALAASSLAGALDYPILLTDQAALPETVATAITDLGATHAIVVGSSTSVSNKVFREIGAAIRGENGTSADVIRLAGSTRLDTQMAIYEYGQARGLWQGDPIIATAWNYPDALSISSYAAAKCSPLFLEDGANGLVDAAKDALVADYAGRRAIIVGSSVAVTSATEAWLASELGVQPVRLAGGLNNSYPSTRYGTSAAIASFCLSEGMSVRTVAVATGQNYPDALVGGPLQAKNNGLVLLVSGNANIAPVDDTAVQAVQDASSSPVDGTRLALFLGSGGENGPLPEDFRADVLVTLAGGLA